MSGGTGRPRGVVRAVGAIALATLASRILGYTRDIVLARAFGASPLSDAFFVAFRIPNLLRRLLAEGALSTAIIPVFSETLARSGPASFGRMVQAVAGVGTVVLAGVSLLGVLLAPWIVALMAPGWKAEAALFDLAVTLTRLMFPYLLLVGLAALAMGVLNTHQRFFTAALAPAILNIAMIGAVLGLGPRMSPPILALGIGVLIGGLGQFLVQLPELRRLGVPLMPALDWSHPALRQIAHRLWPALFPWPRAGAGWEHADRPLFAVEPCPTSLRGPREEFPPASSARARHRRPAQHVEPAARGSTRRSSTLGLPPLSASSPCLRRRLVALAELSSTSARARRIRDRVRSTPRRPSGVLRLPAALSATRITAQRSMPGRYADAVLGDSSRSAKWLFAVAIGPPDQMDGAGLVAVGVLNLAGSRGS